MANWKKFGAQALAGFIAWVLILTPYTLLVIRATANQYLWWLVMEVVIVVPAAPFVIRFTSWFEKLVKA